MSGRPPTTGQHSQTLTTSAIDLSDLITQITREFEFEIWAALQEIGTTFATTLLIFLVYVAETIPTSSVL